MPRISGVDIPEKKRIEIALTYIYGIGRNKSNQILSKLKIEKNKYVSDLSSIQTKAIREYIEKEVIVEGELKEQINTAIRRLIEVKSYRGMRHVKGLPVRGQRTKTNARIRKGKVKTVANKKIAKK